MKKILFSLVALMCSMSMNAQVMKVMKGNVVVATYTADQADNVVFEEEQGSTTGTAKATIGGSEVDVNWVQLWDGGPKFAEYNVGATSATDCGGYYTWGGTYKNGTGIIWNDDHNTSNTGTGNLSGTDDTATQLWGNNWRMPTKAEFEALLNSDNCDVEWTTVNNVNGRKFTGKGNYSSNSVFLPAAGFCLDGGVDDQGKGGYYWSSTPNDSSLVYYLYIHSRRQFVDYVGRDSGCSVRAVLAK